jgi:hypothetical protein
MRLSLTLTLLSTLLLTGCVNDSASYYIADNTHAISVRGHQEYFWDEQLSLTLVASRLPDCQRQIPLTQVDKSDLDVELYQSGADGYILRQGKQIWGVETTNCKAFADAANAPLGARLGAFKMKDDKLTFEAAPQAAAPAAPAADAAAPAEAVSTDAAPADATLAPAEAPAAAPAAEPQR